MTHPIVVYESVWGNTAAVAAGSATLFAIIAAFRRVDPRVVSDRVPHLPARSIAGYVLTIVTLNTLI